MKKVYVLLGFIIISIILSVSCVEGTDYDSIVGHHNNKNAYTWKIQIDKIDKVVFYTDEEPQWIDQGTGTVLAIKSFREENKIIDYREIVSGHDSLRVIKQPARKDMRDESSYAWVVKWDRPAGHDDGYFYSDNKPEWLLGVGNGTLRMTDVRYDGRIYGEYYLAAPNDTVSVAKQ